MSPSRRDLLKILGLTAAGGAGLYPWVSKLSRSQIGPARAVVVSPELDDLREFLKVEDFSWANASTESIATIPEKYRSLLTVVDVASANSQRRFVPGLLHSGRVFGDRAIVVTRGEPSVLYAVDLNAMKIDTTLFPPEGFVFGGHLIHFLESNQFAVTLNSRQYGSYDSVGVYEADGFREIHRMSSFGFQAHDLTLSADRKLLFVGHYGSNFRTGPYHALPNSPLTVANSKETDFDMNGVVFPGSVVAIDLSTGKMVERFCDQKNGPQGHLAVSSQHQIFLAKNPPLLRNRDDVATNAAFNEGTQSKNVFGEFLMTSKVSGTTIVTDDVRKQFLLPVTQEKRIVYGRYDDPDSLRFTETPAELRFPQSLQFHPDGQHYVVSCVDGFAIFDRQSHNLVETRQVKLGIHSHYMIG